MEKQACAFLDHAATERLPCSIVTRHLDGKFSKPFEQVFKDRSIHVKKVGPHAPNLNAFVERWVLSVKPEVIDYFICFGREHFDYIVSSCVDYCHDCRPHLGGGNVLLPRTTSELADGTVVDADTFKPLAIPEVKCVSRLRGLLKHFYRAA